MKDYFLKQLKKIQVDKKSKILLALSGGVDSMVLMDLLHNTHYDFSVAHCNFCLRDKESDEDQKFIELISRSNNIECFVKKFNTKEYAKKNKISTQMAARDLRYSWFYQLSKEYNFDFIATAHHINDSVETFLINLIRGTGISGLHGIKDVDNNIIRPLLTCSKENILQYAQQNNLKYREDSSNKEDKYLRNKIRNKIIPIMKEINPSIISSIGKTICRIGEVESIYNQFVVEKKRKLISQYDDQYKINIKLLLKEVSPKQLLYECIRDFGFYDINAVFNALSSDSGKEFFNNEFYMIKDRNELMISKNITNNVTLINVDTETIQEPFNIRFRVNLSSQINIINASKNSMFIDYEKLKFPLLMRPWRAGDSFTPLGMQGSKKLSDYFIDNKYSLIQKKKARVLISDNTIVCLIGDRLDDRFKLVETSEKVYIVTF